MNIHVIIVDVEETEPIASASHAENIINDFNCRVQPNAGYILLHTYVALTVVACATKKKKESGIKSSGIHEYFRTYFASAMKNICSPRPACRNYVRALSTIAKIIRR